jgi:hypothetical protein
MGAILSEILDLWAPTSAEADGYRRDNGQISPAEAHVRRSCKKPVSCACETPSEFLPDAQRGAKEAVSKFCLGEFHPRFPKAAFYDRLSFTGDRAQGPCLGDSPRNRSHGALDMACPRTS